MSIPKICPLIAAGNPIHMSRCREDGCAWFRIEYDPECGSATGTCALVSIADKLGELAQQNEPPRAANTERLEGGTDLAGPGSASYDTKETEDLQV